MSSLDWTAWNAFLQYRTGGFQQSLTWKNVRPLWILWMFGPPWLQPSGGGRTGTHVSTTSSFMMVLWGYRDSYLPRISNSWLIKIIIFTGCFHAGEATVQDRNPKAAFALCRRVLFCSFSRFQQILRPTKRKENCRATEGIEEGMDSQDDPVGIKHDQTTIDVTMSMLVSVKEIAGFLNGDLTESCPSWLVASTEHRSRSPSPLHGRWKIWGPLWWPVDRFGANEMCAVV